jgi:hypothetical protein
MSNLRLPPYPSGARPAVVDLLKGIIEFDQFDDWLPDAVYYEDQRLNEQRAAQRIEQLWQAGELAVPAGEAVKLPRTNGETVPSLALPLDARVCAHGVIAATAPRIVAALLKDKVYGFEFRKDDQPLFSQPGDGLAELMRNVIAAALFDRVENFQILDVVAFNRNASMARLESILQSAGARPDETNFLRQLMQPGPSGLPSIDDAFAFLYNFYLQPIDQALAVASINFFRYRDEYFVLDDRGKQLVEAQLQRIGLSARVVAQSPPLDVKDKLSEQVGMKLAGQDALEDKEVEEILGKIAGGELIARYECTTWNQDEKLCQTDYYEVVYKSTEVDAAQELFKLSAETHPLDSVQILPLLRAIHQRRRLGVLLRPPFEGAMSALREYRNTLAAGRAWLRDALATALQTGAEWQITWVAPLLSDLGPLHGQEVTLLRQVIAQGNIGQVAKTQARLALARSSTLPAEQFWEPRPTSTRYQLRAAALAARYLANRGSSRPWQRLEPLVGSLEPELKNFLLTSIKGANL